MKRTILITGCSSGIGYDAAHGLTRAGWRVFATCRKPKDCARLRDEGLESFPLDLDDNDSIKAAVREVLDRTGGTLDALYNNGAFAVPGPVEDLPREALRACFETNLFGTHDLTRQVIPIMRAQGHGTIINCSSIIGFVPMKWRGAYVASKYALEGLTDTLRLEMADTPISVTLLEPGPIRSNIRANAIVQFEKWFDWENSARAEQYRASLLKKLYKGSGNSFFQLEPGACTRKILAILESKSPPPRVFVTTPTYGFNVLRRILTTRALDRIIGRG